MLGSLREQPRDQSAVATAAAAAAPNFFSKACRVATWVRPQNPLLTLSAQWILKVFAAGAQGATVPSAARSDAVPQPA